MKLFPYVSYYSSNYSKFIKNQQVKQFSKNKKHLIKYEENKPKQIITQNFYSTTSFWFSQSATHIRLPSPKTLIAAYRITAIDRVNIFTPIYIFLIFLHKYQPFKKKSLSQMILKLKKVDFLAITR